MTIEDLASVCHETNRAYCRTLGDGSQRPWNLVPAWQRQSCIAGVKFHLKNPAANASASHENWLKDKATDGWSYGPVKSPERKQHPCFVPFEQLPMNQQVKDVLLKAVVDGLRNLDG